MSGRTSELHRRAVLGGLGVGTAALAGCSSVTGGASGNHLRVGTIQPPVTLDPIVAKYVGSAQAIERIFDGLYTYGTGTDIVPQIAADSPSMESKLKVTVELDPNAKFQDGKPVTPADVRYSFTIPQKENTATQWAVSPIESVEIVDNQTVKFHLDHPYPGIRDALTQPIVPKHVRQADSKRFSRKPVGAGPYQVQSFSTEEKVKLTRWDGYWGEPMPAIDTVSFVYVKSPITQMTGLISDRTDAITPISPQFRRNIRELTNASVAERPGFRSIYFGFNLNEGPTTERPVREGIVRCIDLEKAVTEFVEPVGRRTYSLLPQRVTEAWEFSVEKWKESIPPKDMSEARRYFERAQNSIGEIKILTSKDPVWKELGEALASGLRDAGQSVLVESVTWKQYLNRYVTGAKRDYAVFVGEVAGNGDPDSFLYPVFHENVQGATNGIFYNEEDVMNQILEARQTTNRERRKSLYESAITTLLEERIHLPICSFQNSFAYNPRIRGFDVHPIPQLNPRVTHPDGRMEVERR